MFWNGHEIIPHDEVHASGLLSRRACRVA
jgi:hypothetical protein